MPSIFFMFAGDVCEHQLRRQRVVQNIGHQRGFAASRNARNANQFSKWNRDIDILKIIGARSDDVQTLAIAFTPLLWISICLRPRDSSVNECGCAMISSGFLPQ